MRLSLTNALGIAAVVTICGCSGGLGGGEPSEAEMKDALLYLMNHPPACDKPTGQGYHCTFDLQVQSANQLAGMYSDIPGANFYKDDKGKWQMRPPF
jgi:hypothetical protein